MESFTCPTARVDATAVIVQGRALPVDELLQAEVRPVSPFGRTALIFVLGCALPILSMIVLTQVLLPQGLVYQTRLHFGPAVFAATTGSGVLACLLALIWRRPWGVTVEHRVRGFRHLATCASQDEAQALATAVNRACGNV